MRIFTDSSCDLPKEFYAEHNVHLFPLRVLVNGQEYDDVYGIETSEVYAAMAEGQQPKTSQVSPEVFYNQFEALAEANEEGLYIAFSSELSGTCNTAMMVQRELLEKYPDFKLTVIDTKCASLGQGLVVKEAVTLRNLGMDYNSVVEGATKKAETMQHLFTVGDLDHLAKGGRVSKTSAFVGGLLNIKPILNVEDGKLVPIEKTRGMKKAIKRMIELMKERGGDFSNKTVGISHSNDEELLHEVKAAIEETLAPREVETTTIGAVIGAHVGSGTVGIYFNTDN